MSTGRTASEEKKYKIKLGEELEKISEMGQESETKAAKSVIELSNIAEKKDKEEEDKILEELTSASKYDKFSYKEKLAIYMNDLLREEGIPKGYHYMIKADLPKGLGLVVWKDPEKLLGHRKLKIIGDAKLDKHACMLFAYWGGDMIYKDYRETTEKSGIIIP